jgi:hypothetical protein
VASWRRDPSEVNCVIDNGFSLKKCKKRKRKIEKLKKIGTQHNKKTNPHSSDASVIVLLPGITQKDSRGPSIRHHRSEKGCGLAVCPCPCVHHKVFVVSVSNTLVVFKSPDLEMREGGLVGDLDLVGLIGIDDGVKFRFENDDMSGIAGMTAFYREDVFEGTAQTRCLASNILFVSDVGHDAVHILDLSDFLLGSGKAKHLGFVSAPGCSTPLKSPRGVASKGVLLAVSTWNFGGDDDDHHHDSHAVHLFLNSASGSSGSSGSSAPGAGFGTPAWAAAWTLVQRIQDPDMSFPCGLRFGTDTGTEDSCHLLVSSEGGLRAFRVHAHADAHAHALAHAHDCLPTSFMSFVHGMDVHQFPPSPSSSSSSTSTMWAVTNGHDVTVLSMGMPKMPHCSFKFETDTGSVTTTADFVHEGPGQVEFQFENTKTQPFSFDYFRLESVVGLADVPHVGLLLRHENGFLSWLCRKTQLPWPP